MSAFKVNEAEWEILRQSEISHAAKLLYLLGLRPRMDYRTGIVGKMRRVSYQAFHEDLEYKPPSGSKSEQRDYTISAIRALLDELTRAGLIRRLPNDKRLIFLECLVADREDAPKNRNDRGTTKRSDTVNDTAKPSNGKGLEAVDNRRNDRGGKGRNDIPLVSGKPIPIINAAASLWVVDNFTRASLLLLPEEIVDWLRHSEKSRGKIMSITVADEAVKSWVYRELQIGELTAAYEMAVADRKKSGNPAPINPGFLNIFVERVIATRVAWFASWEGIVQVGQRYAIEQKPGEPSPAFKARVFAAAGITEEEARAWRP